MRTEKPAGNISILLSHVPEFARKAWGLWPVSEFVHKCSAVCSLLGRSASWRLLGFLAQVGDPDAAGGLAEHQNGDHV